MKALHHSENGEIAAQVTERDNGVYQLNWIETVEDELVRLFDESLFGYGTCKLARETEGHPRGILPWLCSPSTPGILGQRRGGSECRELLLPDFLDRR